MKTYTCEIVDNGDTFTLRIDGANTYNQIGIPKTDLYEKMEYLASVFNNVLKVGICFTLA